MARSTRREHLPLHAIPPAAAHRAAHPEPTLRIEGLVARSCALAPAALAALPRTEITADFACEEGWCVPGLQWRGVRLADVLALAAPLPAARYVRVCAGEYAVPLSLGDAVSALLCNELNGRPLTAASGAPWRLIVPGGACFTSVKWVSHLELTAEPGQRSGERIARVRAGLLPVVGVDRTEDAAS